MKQVGYWPGLVPLASQKGRVSAKPPPRRAMSFPHGRTWKIWKMQGKRVEMGRGWEEMSKINGIRHAEGEKEMWE